MSTAIMITVPLYGGQFTPQQLRTVQVWARELDQAATDDAATARIARHKGIIIALAKRYVDRARQRGLDVADLLQIGALTIIEDSPAYDSAKGEESTFFSVRVYDAMQKAVGARRKTPPPHMVNINSPLSDDNELTLADVLPALVEDADAIGDRLDRATLLAALPRLLDRLDGTNRAIVEMRWLGEMDGEAIAQALSVTRETVRQRLDAAYQLMHPDATVTKQEEMQLFPGEYITHFRPRSRNAVTTPVPSPTQAEQQALF